MSWEWPGLGRFDEGLIRRLTDIGAYIAVSICQDHATNKWRGGASPNAFFAVPNSAITV
jgi:hypothetical protein